MSATTDNNPQQPSEAQPERVTFQMDMRPPVSLGSQYSDMVLGTALDLMNAVRNGRLLSLAVAGVILTDDGTLEPIHLAPACALPVQGSDSTESSLVAIMYSVLSSCGIDATPDDIAAFITQSTRSTVSGDQIEIVGENLDEIAESVTQSTQSAEIAGEYSDEG